MKTIVYIDGFNLYYGLLRGTRNLWLDLERFAQSLLTDQHSIIGLKYFTARVRGDMYDDISAHDQFCYLRALGASPRIKIVEGFYKRYRAKMPFVKEPCRSCDKADYATVWKVEEKKSDVNRAVEMLSDAYEDRAAVFALVSGDSDPAAPLSVVRRRLGKKTVVFNPHSGDSVELRKLTTFYRNIPRELPSKCQLPDEVVLPDGTAVHRPLAWA